MIFTVIILYKVNLIQFHSTTESKGTDKTVDTVS